MHLFGVEAYEGLKTYDLIPPELRVSFQGISETWRKVFEGQRITEEYAYTLPDGEAHHFETRWTPIRLEDRIEYAAEITRDVTEQKSAQRELANSEKMMRLVTDALPALISYIDRDLAYRFSNSAYEKWFGVRNAEVLDRHLRDVIGEDLFIRVAPYIHRVLKGETVHFEVDLERDETIHPFETVYVPNVDHEGKVLGFFVLAQDVSVRKQKDAALQRQREELSHVSRLTTMGELSASLAHELNQPLTAILANAQAALRFLEHPDPDMQEIRSILNDIVQDDKRASQVITRLRAFLSRGEVVMKRWDLNEVIREVVTLVHSDAVIRNVAMDTQLEPDLSPVSFDRVQIQQVLLNLIVNGMEAMQDSAPVDRRLRIESRTIEPGEVMVAIVDSGCGIEAMGSDRLFTPFFSTKPDGMGMGLSINLSIIEAHNGRIWAENNSDRGATFAFTLPLGDEVPS
jgi:two-component system sensor kinase FixL